jgi:hypothetical protein
MPKPNHYYPKYGGLRFGQANNKMIKVKKQNLPMHKLFENILNVLPSNNELQGVFRVRCTLWSHAVNALSAVFFFKYIK